MAARVSGELRTWHKTTLDFTADVAFTESAATFRDYRLDVTFTHQGTGTTITVPGFFAADGDAADTNATSGKIWRVNFNAPIEGNWTYEASFRTGTDIAASTSSTAGKAVAYIDGDGGSFSIAKTNKTGEDFRAKGMILQDEGTHYLQHQGDKDYFVRGGPGVPENFLASKDIDNTLSGRHDYASHSGDFNSGDPTWDGGKGKNLLGAINYLAEQGQNSMYVMLLTAGGDGKDVWPWAATDLGKLSINTAKLDPKITSVYDVSKLAQWETLFDHMDEKGIYKNVLFQEMENDQLLDGGTSVAGTSLSAERLIYMREMIARFGHNNGIQWNLGEENTNTTQQRIDMAEWAKTVDPYDHLVVLHTLRDKYDSDFDPLRGVDEFDGPSYLATSEQIKSVIEEFRDKSATAGDPWVLSWDEDSTKVIDAYSNNPDSSSEKALRDGFWGSLTAGGSGFSWYVKGSSGHSYDQNMDTFDAFQSITKWTAAATDFYNTHIPFWQMKQADGLTSDGDDYVMADPGKVYTIYLPYGEAGDVRLDLTKYANQSFDVFWYNPRTGGSLIADGQVQGGAVRQIGGAPSDAGKDWVLLVRDGGSSSGGGDDDGVPPTPPATSAGYYLEKNGLVKVQFEDVVDGAQGWVYQDASKGNNPGFEGDGYYYWKDQASTGYAATAGEGEFTVTVYIQEAGTYNLFLRAARDSNNPSDARNDVWVKVDNGTVAVMPDGAPAMHTSNGFVKLYGLNSSTAKDWHYAENFDDKNTNKNPASKVVLDEGFHTITFAGRSDGFHIDSFQLTKSASPNTTLVSSQYVEGGIEPEPEPTGGIDAINDSASTRAGASVTVRVLENDVGDGWIGSFTQGSNGSVAKAGGGRMVYTPKAGFEGTDTFTYTAVNNDGDKDTATVTITVGKGSQPAPEPEPEPGITAYRIDSGAAGDKAFSGGSVYKTSAAIAGTTHDALYQTERYGDFDYLLPIANGNYELTLKFAEVYFDAGGKRVFDVRAEGKTVLDDFDIWKAAGDKNVAHDVVVPVTVTDGRLDLKFVSGVNNAKVSGIAVEPASTANLDSGVSAPKVVAAFDLSGPSLAVEDVFLFAFGTDGKAAPLGQSGGMIGVGDIGAATEIDYDRTSTAKSEKIGFDLGEGVGGITLDLAGLGSKNGATEAAIFRTFDPNGVELEVYQLTGNAPKTLDFGTDVRFGTLEASPWISAGAIPSTEPDFQLEAFDTIA